jgi:anaerobic magnesium-protoporphyrin IX monomethyl ester cyclase
MRCCLINPLGRDPSILYSPPLGLAYIAATLEREGHEVRIVDRVAIKYREGEADLKELDKITKREIFEFEPELIGIGATTIQVYDLGHVAKVIRRVRKGGNYPVIAGGFHPTAEPALTLMDYPEIDIVCRGEGEFIMLDLASGKKPEGVPGLTFRKKGKVCSTQDRMPTRNLDTLPFPARHLLDMDFYCRRNDAVISCMPLRVATMLTSRGCPYDCKFCSSKLIYNSQRYHSPEYVLREINLLLENYPIEAISFVDSTLLPKRERLQKICEGLIEQKLHKKLKWGCSLRANLVDKEILTLMKQAGCIFVNYGFESGSQKMLDSMNKRVTVDDNYRAVRLTYEAGILVNSAMIINLPGETEDDMLATIAFLKNNGKRIYSTGLNPLLPLPGSPYYREFIDQGLLEYSDKLWEEVGVLPNSIEQIRLYSQMPRERFTELYNKANKVATRNNVKNYIRVNWSRHPLFLLRKAAKSLRKLRSSLL